jgi:hypothetical protein
MMEASPTKGAGSDESHRDNGSVAGFARWDTLGGCVRTGPSLTEAIEDCPREVEVSLAPDAAVCGCAGCRAGERLLSVTVSSKTRVLCRSCSREFLDREGADE